MKVSKREDFTLLFMSVLARKYSKDFVPISYIAKKHHLSSLFLKHIAVDLKLAGMIESKEGIDGGYRLAKDPKAITLADIVSVTSEKIIIPSCVRGKCKIKKKNCSCFTLWDEVEGVLASYLEKVTLSKFANL